VFLSLLFCFVIRSKFAIEMANTTLPLIFVFYHGKSLAMVNKATSFVTFQWQIFRGKLLKNKI
jgi:hypothetical protein